MEMLVGCSQTRIIGYNEFYNSMDTVMMGGKNFEKTLRLEGHPFKEKNALDFQKTQFKTNNKNKVEIKTSVVEFVKELVTLDEKDIWIVGSSHIISFSILIDTNLVNEIMLSIHPIILGNGTTLFKDMEQQITLKLLGSNTFESGIIQMHYTQ